MPYDDKDVKKMIRYQTERKVSFSRHKKISAEVKELIHGILEANTDRRFSISDVCGSAWMTQTQDSATSPPTAAAAAGSRDKIGSDGGQQSEQCARQAADEFDRRAPSTSVNNNNDMDTATRGLPSRPVDVTTATELAGADVAHLVHGHRTTATQQVMPRSTVSKHADPASPKPPHFCSAGVNVIRVRGRGR